MKHINNIINGLLLILGIALIASSCAKETNQEFTPKRMFTPGTIDATSGETQAKLTWNPSLFTEGKDVQYTVQIARDSSFQTIEKTVVVDTSSLTFSEDDLVIKQKYVARIKANAYNNIPESNWMISPKFSITGEQLFLPLDLTGLKDKSVILNWRVAQGLTKIVLTAAGGQTIEAPLSATDLTDAKKQVTGLTPQTDYTAELFAGTKSKGTITFTTKELSQFTVELTPLDNLLDAIANAANNDVIGLKPGTYNYPADKFNIVGKQITLRSTSGDWRDTKVIFNEVTLKGTGAGIKIFGIEFDGTPGAASYFINLTGVLADAENATFRSIVVENSVVHGTANCLIRGNRGANNAYKIDLIKFDNDILYDNGSGGYDYILLDKMEFNRLELTRSTLYNSGRRLISWASAITAPTPTILVDAVTINNLGYGARDYVLLDVNSNPVDFTMQNSIVANIPKPGQTVGKNFLRASSGSALVKFEYNNTFKISTGAATPESLVFPATVQQTGNTSIDLGWTATTTDFSIPAGSPLRSSGRGGVAVGDPRWVK